MNFGAEFQAVIMAAGKGTRMPEVTAGKPKCLLPVGPRPLVWYPLLKLQETGFTDVIMVIFENQKQEIQSALDKTDLKIRIEYFSIPSTEDLGTADTLRLLHDKIKCDVVVLSCDLITDFNFYEIFNEYRMHKASVLSLFFQSEPEGNIVVPGPKQKHKPERDFIVLDKHTSRLIMLASASDFEEYVSISDNLLEKHFASVVHCNLIDSHLYILRHWIVKYLQHNTNISTIKGELLPHIVSKQHPPPTPPAKDANLSIVNTTESNDIFHFAKESDLELQIRKTSTFMDHTGDMAECYHGDTIRCYGHVSKNSFGVRVNTLPAYWSINGKISDIWENITHGKMIKVDPKATVKSTQVDEKCIIWDLVTLNEKTSFKNSVIGTQTEVNSFSRVFNSIVMNNVVIKEKVALENCIVCDGAVIENGTQLKGCLVGSHYTVPDQSQHTNEVLTDVSRLMEF